MNLEVTKNKNRIYPEFLRTRLPETLKQIKMFRNRLNAQLKRAKIIYYQELLTNIGAKRPHAVWNMVNSILGRKNVNSAPGDIIFNGNIITGKALQTTPICILFHTLLPSGICRCQKCYSLDLPVAYFLIRQANQKFAVPSRVWTTARPSILITYR